MGKCSSKERAGRAVVSNIKAIQKASGSTQSNDSSKTSQENEASQTSQYGNLSEFSSTIEAICSTSSQGKQVSSSIFYGDTGSERFHDAEEELSELIEESNVAQVFTLERRVREATISLEKRAIEQTKKAFEIKEIPGDLDTSKSDTSLEKEVDIESIKTVLEPKPKTDITHDSDVLGRKDSKERLAKGSVIQKEKKDPKYLSNSKRGKLKENSTEVVEGISHVSREIQNGSGKDSINMKSEMLLPFQDSKESECKEKQEAGTTILEENFAIISQSRLPLYSNSRSVSQTMGVKHATKIGESDISNSAVFISHCEKEKAEISTSKEETTTTDLESKIDKELRFQTKCNIDTIIKEKSSSSKKKPDVTELEENNDQEIFSESKSSSRSYLPVDTGRKIKGISKLEFSFGIPIDDSDLQTPIFSRASIFPSHFKDKHEFDTEILISKPEEIMPVVERECWNNKQSSFLDTCTPTKVADNHMLIVSEKNEVHNMLLMINGSKVTKAKELEKTVDEGVTHIETTSHAQDEMHLIGEYTTTQECLKTELVDGMNVEPKAEFVAIQVQGDLSEKELVEQEDRHVEEVRFHLSVMEEWQEIEHEESLVISTSTQHQTAEEMHGGKEMMEDEPFDAQFNDGIVTSNDLNFEKVALRDVIAEYLVQSQIDEHVETAVNIEAKQTTKKQDIQQREKRKITTHLDITANEADVGAGEVSKSSVQENQIDVTLHGVESKEVGKQVEENLEEAMNDVETNVHLRDEAHLIVVHTTIQGCVGVKQDELKEKYIVQDKEELNEEEVTDSVVLLKEQKVQEGIVGDIEIKQIIEQVEGAVETLIQQKDEKEATSYPHFAAKEVDAKLYSETIVQETQTNAAIHEKDTESEVTEARQMEETLAATINYVEVDTYVQDGANLIVEGQFLAVQDKKDLEEQQLDKDIDVPQGIETIIQANKQEKLTPHLDVHIEEDDVQVVSEVNIQENKIEDIVHKKDINVELVEARQVDEILQEATNHERNDVLIQDDVHLVIKRISIEKQFEAVLMGALEATVIGIKMEGELATIQDKVDLNEQKMVKDTNLHIDKEKVHWDNVVRDINQESLQEIKDPESLVNSTGLKQPIVDEVIAELLVQSQSNKHVQIADEIKIKHVQNEVHLNVEEVEAVAEPIAQSQSDEYLRITDEIEVTYIQDDEHLIVPHVEAREYFGTKLVDAQTESIEVAPKEEFIAAQVQKDLNEKEVVEHTDVHVEEVGADLGAIVHVDGELHEIIHELPLNIFISSQQDGDREDIENEALDIQLVDGLVTDAHLKAEEVVLEVVIAEHLVKSEIDESVEIADQVGIEQTTVDVEMEIETIFQHADEEEITPQLDVAVEEVDNTDIEENAILDAIVRENKIFAPPYRGRIKSEVVETNKIEANVEEEISHIEIILHVQNDPQSIVEHARSEETLQVEQTEIKEKVQVEENLNAEELVEDIILAEEQNVHEEDIETKQTTQELEIVVETAIQQNEEEVITHLDVAVSKDRLQESQIEVVIHEKAIELAPIEARQVEKMVREEIGHVEIDVLIQDDMHLVTESVPVEEYLEAVLVVDAQETGDIAVKMEGELTTLQNKEDLKEEQLFEDDDVHVKEETMYLNAQKFMQEIKDEESLVNSIDVKLTMIPEEVAAEPFARSQSEENTRIADENEISCVQDKEHLTVQHVEPQEIFERKLVDAQKEGIEVATEEEFVAAQVQEDLNEKEVIEHANVHVKEVGADLGTMIHMDKELHEIEQEISLIISTSSQQDGDRKIIENETLDVQLADGLVTVAHLKAEEVALEDVIAEHLIKSEIDESVENADHVGDKVLDQDIENTSLMHLIYDDSEDEDAEDYGNHFKKRRRNIKCPIKQ